MKVLKALSAVSASSLLALLSFNAMAGVTLDSWRMLPSKVVSMPLMIDSLDNKGKAFDISALLETQSDIQFSGKDYAVIAATGSGEIELPSNESESIVILQTPVRAERFAKGVLRITSTSPFQLLVDGDTKLRHAKSAESIADAKVEEIPFVLEPERDRLLTIKFATDGKIKPVFKAEFVAEQGLENVRIYSDASLSRRFSLADLELGKRVKNMQLSNDGRYLLYTLSEKRNPATTTHETKLRDLQTGRETYLSPNTNYKWMPRSAKLYFTRQASEGYELLTQNPATGEQQVVASCLPVDNVLWNTAENRLLFRSKQSGRPDEGPIHHYTTLEDRIPGSRDVYQIGEYSLSDGLVRMLTYGSRSADICDIHPTADKILIKVETPMPTQRPFSTSFLIELDLLTMKADIIIASLSFFDTAVYSPDGKKIAVTGSAAAFDNLGKNCGDHPIVNDYDKQLYILSLSDKTVKPVSLDFDPSLRGAPVWNRRDGKLYFLTNEGFCVNLYSFDPAKEKYEKLPLQIENITNFSIARDGSEVAYFGQNAVSTGSGWLYNVRNKKHTLVVDPLKDRFSEIEMARIEPWKFTASDGTEIDGIACYPPDFDPAKKYPLIVYYYGGTNPSMLGVGHAYSPQVFASRDYMVYIVNPSGCTGYGQEFSARHVNAWGKRTADDIIEGTREFIAQHPQVDKDKVGCLGASYGGFLTQYILTKTDLFAAAASHAGISALSSYWGEGYWGYLYNGYAACESYPWNNPELFTRQGSLYNADKIDTPLLLLHGTEDTNVPIGESIQIFNALKILGKEVDFVTVEGENHVITDSEKRFLWQNTIMAWFAKWLQDDPSWWNHLYSTPGK